MKISAAHGAAFSRMYDVILTFSAAFIFIPWLIGALCTACGCSNRSSVGSLRPKTKGAECFVYFNFLKLIFHKLISLMTEHWKTSRGDIWY